MSDTYNLEKDYELLAKSVDNLIEISGITTK